MQLDQTKLVKLLKGFLKFFLINFIKKKYITIEIWDKYIKHKVRISPYLFKRAYQSLHKTIKCVSVRMARETSKMPSTPTKYYKELPYAALLCICAHTTTLHFIRYF